MRERASVLVAGCMVLWGCQSPLEPQAAEAAARAHAGPAVAKGAWFTADDELAELARVGLVQYTQGNRLVTRKLSLAPGASELGLDVFGGGGGFGPAGIKIERLCEVDFAAVTAITPLEGGPLRASTVSYHRTNVRQTPLYARLGDAKVAARAYCDPGARYERRLVMVKREAGWLPNQVPVVRGESSSEMRFSYDPQGLRDGAVTRLKLAGIQVSDPDGDATTVVGWKAERFTQIVGPEEQEEMEMRPAELKIEGDVAVFEHHIQWGEPSGAIVRYVVGDPWEEGGFRYCIEGYRFRC